MGQVVLDISMSLDGFITGPNESVDQLHQWLYDLTSWRERHGIAGGRNNLDAEVLDEAFKNVGAILMGRRMFDVAEGPWGDNPPFHVPVFVLTHRAHDRMAKEGGTTFTFVTDGLKSAFHQAQAAARENDVSVAGGATIIQQCLRAGLLDEMQIHLVPVLLGDGRRLFEHIGPQPVEMERTRVIESPGVTHLTFRIVK